MMFQNASLEFSKFLIWMMNYDKTKNGNQPGYHEFLHFVHNSSFWSFLDLTLHILVDFYFKNIYCHDIILPDYIKCDFGADFNQKWQISILLLLLKNGHEV